MQNIQNQNPQDPMQQIMAVVMEMLSQGNDEASIFKALQAKGVPSELILSAFAAAGYEENELISALQSAEQSQQSQQPEEEMEMAPGQEQYRYGGYKKCMKCGGALKKAQVGEEVNLRKQPYNYTTNDIYSGITMDLSQFDQAPMFIKGNTEGGFATSDSDIYSGQEATPTNGYGIQNTGFKTPARQNFEQRAENFFQTPPQDKTMNFNFSDAADAGLGVLKMTNSFFNPGKERKAKRDLYANTQADKAFGMVENPANKQGMWDVNSGLAEQDNYVPYMKRGGYYQEGGENVRVQGGNTGFTQEELVKISAMYNKTPEEFLDIIMNGEISPDNGSMYRLDGANTGIPADYLKQYRSKSKKASFKKGGYYQQGGESNSEAYRKQKAYLQEIGDAIGRNDQEALKRLNIQDDPRNYYAGEFAKTQQMRKNNNLGISEEASILFPFVGQQIRGTANSWFGTNFKRGGQVTEMELDSKTIAELIAAGADIEIL